MPSGEGGTSENKSGKRSLGLSRAAFWLPAFQNLADSFSAEEEEVVMSLLLVDGVRVYEMG